MGVDSAASTATSASSAAAPGASFSDFLSSTVKDAVGSLKQGEQMAAKQAAGQADIVDVVNAVNQAELTLDTVMAVRDKVIAAYQDIMRMPI
ncbi:MAG: flagellar hook-basal body complex protein FliE [Alphaproteobacteria bacterium]|nr:flagellar hook-basal body complex protein FliE [Alphaproteobacteria bacterium]